MSKFTKRAIIETFINLLEEKSLDKISIKDLILKTEINRNTFYYYYQDIYSLLNDIFNNEVEKFRKEISEDSSFYDEYIRAANLFLTKRTAIIHIYQSKSRDLIKRYLTEVVFDFVGRFVKRACEGKNITENQHVYITSFYSYSIIGNTMHWIEDGLPQYRENLIKMISRTFDATINQMIDDVEKAGKDNMFDKLKFSQIT